MSEIQLVNPYKANVIPIWSIKVGMIVIVCNSDNYVISRFVPNIKVGN